jgi:uncharacterized protein YfkK (UPF0435 family)
MKDVERTFGVFQAQLSFINQHVFEIKKYDREDDQEIHDIDKIDFNCEPNN